MQSAALRETPVRDRVIVVSKSITRKNEFSWFYSLDVDMHDCEYS